MKQYNKEYDNIHTHTLHYILLQYNIQHILNTNVNTTQYNTYEVYKYAL